MNRVSLDGLLAELDRTQERCHELVTCWVDFLGTNPYPSRIVHDVIDDWYRVLFDFSRGVPWDVALKLSRIARSLGAILDDAVRTEAVSFLGRELTLSEIRAIAYPVRWSSDELERASARQFVSEAAWAIVARHQPYAAARSLGLLHWRSGLEQSGRIHPALPPGFESFRPFYTFDAAHARSVEVVHDLDPWSPLEGLTEFVRIRFARNGHDPKLRVQRTPLLHVSCGPLPDGVHYAGATEMVKDVRSVIADFADLERHTTSVLLSPA